LLKVILVVVVSLVVTGCDFNGTGKVRNSPINGSANCVGDVCWFTD
jgi:hypothetical protein